MTMVTWLADALRAGGCKVSEVDGWRARGRAEMGEVRGVLCHHTGGPLTGDHPSLDLVLNGRPDLAGPLSHLVLGRDGTFFVIAAGRCNHAGAGEWQGITAGNSSFIGIEAENAGTPADPWPPVQMAAYQRGCAAILRHLGAGPLMVAGHREYALPKGRKIDPLFDMDRFRAAVASILDGAPPPDTAKPLPVEPARAMLRLGDTGASVRDLQSGIGAKVDGEFGPVTERALKAYQAAHHLTADGLAGPATWASLGIKGGCGHETA